MLSELPFYDELNIVQTVAAEVMAYPRSYSTETLRSEDDPLVQLETSKPVVKDFFWDLLTEMKGFKYQITLKVKLRKQKQNRDTEFSTVYFSSFATTVINTNKYGLNKSF